MSDEHHQLLDSFARFVDRSLRPLDQAGPAVDEVAAELRALVRQRAGAAGFYAPDFPAAFGGQDLDQLGAARLRMAAARSSCALAQYAVAGPEGPTPLLLSATPEQQKRYLTPLVRGELTRCLALSEPEAGSDASALRTTAERDADGWRINGVKTFVTNGAEADVALVVARTAESAIPLRGSVPAATVFLVDKGTPGYRPTRRIGCMWQGEPRWEVVLDDCRVPDSHVLGGPEAVGLGLYVVLESFLAGRVAIAAKCVGMAYRAYDLALPYARDRKAFGAPIGSYQHVQRLLVDAHTRLRAAELVVLDAAERVDAGTATPADAATAKLVASEWAGDIIDDMLQVFGGAGYSRDLPIEGLLRQARLYRIVDGTSEVQRVIIARELLGR
jgi:alkylation response protein AidB-like acyl-CoA dehydrogenase